MSADQNGAAAQVLVDSRDAVARALGSNEPVLLNDDLSGSDQLVILGQRLRARLRSTGGRPSDPAWTTSRRIPFQADVWDHVRDAAERVSAVTGYKVSPAQLCGQIIEDRLSDLDDAALRAFEEQTSSPNEE